MANNNYVLQTSNQPPNQFQVVASGDARPALFNAVSESHVFPVPVNRLDSADSSVYTFDDSHQGASLLASVRAWLTSSGFGWEEN